MKALDSIVRDVAASAFRTLAMDLSLYKAIWKYDLETLRKDLSAHLVFGTSTAAAFRLLPHGHEKGQTQS
jgi:hypothetical protein